jgi:hypothetical protein
LDDVKVHEVIQAAVNKKYENKNLKVYLFFSVILVSQPDKLFFFDFARYLEAY